MSHMAQTIGVRELRRDLSGYLRRVEKGESFAVTSRGRAIAVLGPSGEQHDPVDRLIIGRHAIPARLDLLEVDALELPGGPVLSALLDELRADRL
jgi:prevent-host-death family protein